MLVLIEGDLTFTTDKLEEESDDDKEAMVVMLCLGPTRRGSICGCSQWK